MRFSLWTLGAPGALALFAAVMRTSADGSLFFGGLAGVAGLLFLCAIPLNVIYWLVRLVRYAWRSPAASASSRPGSWIYPEQPR